MLYVSGSLLYPRHDYRGSSDYTLVMCTIILICAVGQKLTDTLYTCSGMPKIMILRVAKCRIQIKK